MTYLDELNPAQRAAVVFGVAEDRPTRSTPPLLVIAGAGSGKTSTLAHRVAHLILTALILGAFFFSPLPAGWPPR